MSPQFDAIGMVVADMADSVAFYRLLGLTFPEGAEGEGHVEGDLPGGIRLMLDTEDMVRSFDPTFEPLPGPGRIGLAFLCEGPDEVDRVYDAFCEAGYRAERPPFDAFWGQRYATVLDPDGNAVNLFAPLSDGNEFLG
jgi:catechol 2,3-dioxygenase-like lactoylglutathione lyase family enzyme